MTDLLRASALDLAGLVRSGEISSEELTRFFLERIEKYDERLSSFVTVLRRRSVLAARRADQRTRRHAPADLPVFHGVPVGIKDLVPMLGTPTKLGSRAYKWFVSPFDAPAAKRIKRAGFIVLGKLSTSEFGVLPVTEPDIHPPTRNPWNDDHTPGGSSGGSGSAVAAGLIPIAHGSDGGGSVRIPAAFCHLFGFKPSLSLLGNMHGRVNKRLGLSVMGPLSHTVEDAAAMLDVLRGHPDGHLERGGDFCFSQCRQRVRPLRIRMTVETPIGEVAPPIAQAVHRTARLLEELGHHVEQGPMIDGRVEDFLPLWQAQLAGVPTPSDAKLQAITRWLRREGRSLDPQEVSRRHQALEDKVDEFFGEADIALSPTVPIYPPRIGEFDGLEPEALFNAIAPCGAFTALFNVTRGPAANIPAGISPEGLPYGVQLGARVGQDGALLALCKQLEDAMPWRDRHAAAYFSD